MPTLITYIGKRERYVDGLYDTGEWIKGQTKPVHDQTAAKMVKHIDQYAKTEAEAVVGEPKPKDEAETVAKTEAEAVVGEPKPKDEDSDQEVQDARDAVAHMDKDALLNFANTNFRQQLDKRMSVENARAKVIGLIDQYGLK